MALTSELIAEMSPNQYSTYIPRNKWEKFKGKYSSNVLFWKKVFIHGRIELFNKEGTELIRDFLGKKNTFIYLDPPYYEKGATLYLNHYKKNDHQKLAKQLNKRSKSFWVLTYDNNKVIKSLYKDRKIVNFSLGYSVRESRKGKELMILSDAFSNSLMQTQKCIQS